jgi:hypothetical protein
MTHLPAMCRSKTFFILLGISALSYLFDCELATLLKACPDSLPFFERGPYTGICFLVSATVEVTLQFSVPDCGHSRETAVGPMRDTGEVPTRRRSPSGQLRPVSTRNWSPRSCRSRLAVSLHLCFAIRSGDSVAYQELEA